MRYPPEVDCLCLMMLSERYHWLDSQQPDWSFVILSSLSLKEGTLFEKNQNFNWFGFFVISTVWIKMCLSPNWWYFPRMSSFYTRISEIIWIDFRNLLSWIEILNASASNVLTRTKISNSNMLSSLTVNQLGDFMHSLYNFCRSFDLDR